MASGRRNFNRDGEEVAGCSSSSTLVAKFRSSMKLGFEENQLGFYSRVIARNSVSLREAKGNFTCDSPRGGIDACKCMDLKAKCSMNEDLTSRSEPKTKRAKVLTPSETELDEFFASFEEESHRNFSKKYARFSKPTYADLSESEPSKITSADTISTSRMSCRWMGATNGCNQNNERSLIS